MVLYISEALCFTYLESCSPVNLQRPLLLKIGNNLFFQLCCQTNAHVTILVNSWQQELSIEGRDWIAKMKGAAGNVPVSGSFQRLNTETHGMAQLKSNVPAQRDMIITWLLEVLLLCDFCLTQRSRKPLMQD